jgi:hypothetical protein
MASGRDRSGACFSNRAIGLSETLCVFDGGNAAGHGSDLPDSERVALADYMIALWSRFREPKIQTANNEAQSPFAAFGDVEEKSNHYGDLEEQICDLLRAADLSATLPESLLSEGRIEKNSANIYLPDQFAERLIFAAYEVEKRADALKDFMYGDGAA